MRIHTSQFGSITVIGNGIEMFRKKCGLKCYRLDLAVCVNECCDVQKLNLFHFYNAWRHIGCIMYTQNLVLVTRVTLANDLFDLYV